MRLLSFIRITRTLKNINNTYIIMKITIRKEAVIEHDFKKVC